jgi:hypothetical protein
MDSKLHALQHFQPPMLKVCKRAPIAALEFNPNDSSVGGEKQPIRPPLNPRDFEQYAIMLFGYRHTRPLYRAFCLDT